MSQDSNLFSTRTCKFAFVVVALTAAFVLPAKAQRTWNITVNIPSSGSKLTYGLTCVPAPCPNNPPDGTEITIALGDEVYWSTSQRNAEMWIFHNDPILDEDHSGHATHLHHGKNATVGGVTHAGTPPSSTKHEYYVLVYTDTGTLYFDDPRIIVGGSPPAIEKQIEEIKKQVKELGAKSDVAKGLIKDILSDLDSLKKELDKQ